MLRLKVFLNFIYTEDIEGLHAWNQIHVDVLDTLTRGQNYQWPQVQVFLKANKASGRRRLSRSMATSSEDVLLLVNHVRHQKKDGTLYVMAERLAWIADGKDVFSVSHKYADIKTQKISPDGKAKLQLQVVLHDSGASTFHFANPVGAQAQLKDRNDVKELLQQLLPKFKRKVNKELEEKNRLLMENPDLLQLYRDLVTSQVITPEEFWADHAIRCSSIMANAVQEIGVSGAFLAEVKPQVDGCNGLKYNLSADLIYSIFKTYPAVKKKHLEYVPHKMTEGEFWTRFFQSHYFHRDRINAGNKDVFAECAKNDELDIKLELSKASGDPLHDVTSFGDGSIYEGYGVGAKDGASSTNAANKNLVRRFNHHSMMVLKACQTSRHPVECTVLPTLPVTTNGKQSNGALNVTNSFEVVSGSSKDAPVEDEPLSKKARLMEKTAYEDLEGCSSEQATELRLHRKERYLHGPTPSVASEGAADTDLLSSTMSDMCSEVLAWEQNLSTVLPSNVAVSVLQELSPNGILMKNPHTDSLDQIVPDDVQGELKNLYGALSELLRHFWSCFPVTSKAHQEKVTRMRATLERFQYAKLKPFRDQLLRDHLNTNLTDHLVDMLETSYAKFHNWQAKRVNLKL